MRNLFTLSLAAAVACGGSQTFKDKSRDALPSKDSVAIGAPQSPTSQSVAPPDQITQDSTAGQHSPFFDLTVGVSATFNGGVAVMLGIVEAVTDNEPTSCTATSCTWGPGHGPFDYNDYKLVVTQAGDGFDWNLSGRDIHAAATADFTVILTGHAVPGPQRHHGSGNFSVDFDAAATLPGPHDATGKLDVTSYSNVGPAHLDVTYLGRTASTPASSTTSSTHTRTTTRAAATSTSPFTTPPATTTSRCTRAGRTAAPAARTCRAPAAA